MKIEKKYLILNPVCVFVGTWLVVLLFDRIYGLALGEPFYPFSMSLLYLAVAVLLCWTAGFVCASFIPAPYFRVRNPFNLRKLASFYQTSRIFLACMLFALVVIGADHFLWVGPGFLLPDGVMQYRIILTMEGGSPKFPWVSLFNFFFFFYPAFIASWAFSTERFRWPLFIAGLVCFCMFVYLSTARSAIFFPLLLTFFVILQYKFRIRYFAYLFLLLFTLFGAIGALVGKAGFDKIFFYILSPIHAFDLIFSGAIHYAPGFLSFRIFHPILERLDIVQASLVALDNINTPMPTNVFTVFGVYFLDYGLWGLLCFMFFFSFLSALVYYLALYRHSPRTNVFCAMSYVLIVLGVFYDYYTSTFFIFFAFFYIQLFFPQASTNHWKPCSRGNTQSALHTFHYK
ncbi:O-antigen polymerase [Pseudomonas sp. HR96]|uniref:O-antigen polymerase n=1 Tax=Pseudomonas sp. HR96 TaxID=1027966 RepID=UPI002A75AD11|nr:O-antigen polymerase [Pseudomonas sp. HR96]WPO98864.1 O-antigen polymerase [Pseudomonas sp. HR96]